MKNDDDVCTMLMCNEQYSCVGPIELLCTINKTPDGILNLLRSIIPLTHDAMLYHNDKWNISQLRDFLGYLFTRTNPIRFQIPSRSSIEKLKDVIKKIALIGVPFMKFTNHNWSDNYSFDNQTIQNILKKLIEH